MLCTNIDRVRQIQYRLFIWELEPLDDGVLFQNVMRVHYNGLWWDGYGWGVLYVMSIVIDLVVKNILIFNYLLRKKIDLFILCKMANPDGASAFLE